MGALLDEPAAIEGKNPVGVPQGREPVGDGDRRAAPNECGEGLLDLPLRLGVDRACGLVED